MDQSGFTVNCTGDVCRGDTILFEENVFGFAGGKPKPMGRRTIAARVIRDSYGFVKQQHTFSLEIIACEGAHPIAPGTRTTRKGRNVYRCGTLRQPWPNENDRRAVLDEKHARGDAARRVRDLCRDTDYD